MGLDWSPTSMTTDGSGVEKRAGWKPLSLSRSLKDTRFNDEFRDQWSPTHAYKSLLRNGK
ncbi:hypothetical protein TWF751_008566 [Orbilia oligospora]|nr:hypothetical protein TWF751_008566 [Orbilia oligospora]